MRRNSPYTWDVDWNNVLAQVNAAQNGEHINIITGAAFAVPGKVIQILTGTDKALALHLGKGTAVGIYGKNILNSAALGLTFAETADMPKAADTLSSIAAVETLSDDPTKKTRIQKLSIYPLVILFENFIYYKLNLSVLDETVMWIKDLGREKVRSI